MSTEDGGPGKDPTLTARLATFRELMAAFEQADAHPDSEHVQRRKDVVLSRWLAEGRARDAAKTREQRLIDELDMAEATVAQVALSEGQRALAADDLAGAAQRWRVAAILSCPQMEQEFGEEPVLLRLIELYLKLDKPGLALAWCTIAGTEGVPIGQVEPLITRAWATLARRGRAT